MQISKRYFALGAMATLCGVLTAPGSAYASETPPTITGHTFGNHRVNISWSGPDQYDVFNSRYADGVLGTSQDRQIQVGSGNGGNFSLRPDSPGTWVFIVEGCRGGVFRSDCSKWSQQVSVVAPTEAPPQTQTLSWAPDSAGDCHMQNATVTFSSYGDAQFSAQVKTDHTHTSDVWHATLWPENAAGKGLLPSKTFDSMKMSDDHGWYNWTEHWEFDASQFPQIAKWHKLNKC